MNNYIHWYRKRVPFYKCISGEQYIEKLESSFYKGGKERVAMQLLNDFRKGIMGCIPLELPKN